MRIAFLLGFFDPVKKALDENFPSELELGSIIWIQQLAPMREVNLAQFKSRFFDLRRDTERVLIILALLRERLYVEGKVNEIIQVGQSRRPDLIIEPLVVERNAAASDFVIGKLREFSPSTAQGISVHLLRARLGSHKVLCVRETKVPGFQDALKRAGFPDEAWEEFFLEVEFDSTASPDLFVERMKPFTHVLYAFHGFPHAFSNGFETKDGRFKGRLAREAVSQFRLWLLRVT